METPFPSNTYCHPGNLCFMDPRFRTCTLDHTTYKDETNSRSRFSLLCHQVTRNALNSARYKGKRYACGFHLSVFLQFLNMSMALICWVHPPPTHPVGAVGMLEIEKKSAKYNFHMVSMQL